MEKQKYIIFTTITLFFLPLVLFSCGSNGYLNNKERVELQLIVKRAATAQKQLNTPSLQSAQTVLEVIQDAKPLIQTCVKKAPPPHIENLEKVEAAWKKQALETMQIGKSRDMQTFYKHLKETIHLTLELLKKIHEIDNQT
ncbi:hypothetical protein GF373_11630 [bacterium]|nr:hypothetical protein [bacterium]